ncbi:MAG: sterol carrier family protein [Rhodobacteraceae bacterium]|nr:sterol carrier family protein [Paracoccaceae bacterium]
MSEFLQDILEELKPRLEEASFDGTAKLDIPDEGAIVFTSDTAEISDADADVTMSADADTIRAMFNKELDPTAAFMSGKLAVDGDMGLAMQLASVLG